MEWDLRDKPRAYVKHCIDRIAKVEEYEKSNIILKDSENEEKNKMFSVKSLSSDDYHEVYLGNSYMYPSCTCKDWKKFIMPCKHLLAIFEFIPGISWSSLGEIYRKSPFFTIDYEVFGMTKPCEVSNDVQEEDEDEGQDKEVEENQEENYVETHEPHESQIEQENNTHTFNELEKTKKQTNNKLKFNCRKILKMIKSLTFLVDDTSALEDLNEDLRELHDRFKEFTPIDHGLVVEDPKAKKQIQNVLKRKAWENLPVPKEKKSKLTGRVGITSEAKRLACNITIPKDAPKITSKIETCEVVLDDVFMNDDVTEDIDEHHFISNSHIPDMAENKRSNEAPNICKKIKKEKEIEMSKLDKKVKERDVSMESKIITRYPSIPLSSALLKIGQYTVTYLDLLSVEIAHSASQLTNIRKCDAKFRTGWLHDEIINSFLYVSIKNDKRFLLCNSTAALCTLRGSSIRNLWKGEDISSVFNVIIPFNPNNCHWLLIILNIDQKTISVLDPLLRDTNWSNTSVKKAFQVGVRIMETKFDIANVTKANMKHIPQSDSVSCGVMVCYYASQIIKGNTFSSHIVFFYIF